MTQAFDPFLDANFFSFFPLFFKRLYLFFSGQLASFASDEIQFFTLSLVGLMGAFLGTFLLLRKMAMLANALSHTTLLGIVLAYLICHHFFPFQESFSLPMALLFPVAALTGIFTMFLTNFLHRTTFLPEEASTGLVFSCLFALGIVLLSFAGKNLHLGTELIVGNADALTKEDMGLLFRVFAVVFGLFFLFYKEMKMTSFDPLLAKVAGVNPAFYSYLLMVLTSLALIASFRAAGVLMGLSFFVALPLIARRFTSRLLPLISLAALISTAASLLGVALSRHLLTAYSFSISTSGLIVSLLFLSYVVVILREWRAKLIV